MKLTERVIEKLTCPEGARDRMVFDSEQRGLAVRILASGPKSYLAQYTLGGRKRRVALGSVQSISLSMARDAARAVLGQVAMGIDVASVRKEQAEQAKTDAQRERLTLGTLVADWKSMHLSARRESYSDGAPKALERAFGDWWSRPAERLDKAGVLRVLDRLSPSVRRSVGAYGRACYGWAVRRGSLTANPFDSIPGFSTTKQRDRVLSDDELVSVWSAAAAMAAPYGLIVRMLILTGQRREEVAGMMWAEVSSDRRNWSIPAARAKNGVTSMVPLSDAVRSMLPAGVSKGLVFPGDSGRLFGNWSKAKAVLDKASGVTGWRLHDIRRTCATGLQRLGVRYEVTEAVLNHVSGSRRGVAGIYQRHDWALEKRAALEAWATHVTKIVDGHNEPENVVALAAARL